MKSPRSPSRAGGKTIRPLLLLLTFALVAPSAVAFHDECPATTATLTLRVLDGGVYVLAPEVWQETNGHAGLQRGPLPPGCPADTRIA